MNSVDERLHINLYDSSEIASVAIARKIADLIKERQAEKKEVVLGLVAGSSPIAVYNELVRMHREEELSFANVITFNVDEYFPIKKSSSRSVEQYMNENLFKHIDINKNNIHSLNFGSSENKIAKYCAQYEKDIIKAGGIDLILIGVGRAGQIGHNEPGATQFSRTRLVKLGPVTRYDAADSFSGEDNVPYNAVTMGITTILEAKKIYLMAWGETKASIISEAVEGEVRESIPVSYLQYHKDTELFLDNGAASKLSRIQTPWLLGFCEWNDRLIRKAVIWLCQRVNKPVLKLTDKDYQDNSMFEIIQNSSAYHINIKVFNDLQHTITGWPGGKPDADDSQRPERSNPASKRVVVFSPHPDDDVISMGGTLGRLVKQGHDVHVAYQTSGNTAVSDEDVLRYVEFLKDTSKYLGADNERLNRYINYLNGKCKDCVDKKDIRDFKGLIRRGEARAACRFLGVKEENIHFLDLPFYETGSIKKGEISRADTAIIIDLLRKIKPHQIFAAGDLSDPHGTHRNCMKAINMSIDEISSDKWLKDCYMWLYRGAWQEWNVEDVDMAVPLSPDEVMQKRYSIFKHQSQKDGALFPGSDTREFWQRAKERNHNTAYIYDKLGMAEYEAMEVFVRQII